MTFLILLVEESFQAELECEKESRCGFVMNSIGLLEVWGEGLGWIMADTSLILKESPQWLELERLAEQKYYEDEAERVCN